MDQPLRPGAEVALSPERVHHLRTVMRLKAGAPVCLFNARDGEWAGRITRIGRHDGLVAVAVMTRAPAPEPGPWLLPALIKRHRFELIIEKATELGAAVIQPVRTRFTDIGGFKRQRHVAQAIEAAEQCGRLSLPEIRDPVSLPQLLAGWPADRDLYWADERREAPVFAPARRAGDRAAILIGPEGGFAAEERTALEAAPGALAMSLGPRILRAETAAIAALALWQFGCRRDADQTND